MTCFCSLHSVFPCRTSPPDGGWKPAGGKPALDTMVFEEGLARQGQSVPSKDSDEHLFEGETTPLCNGTVFCPVDMAAMEKFVPQWDRQRSVAGCPGSGTVSVFLSLASSPKAPLKPVPSTHRPIDGRLQFRPASVFALQKKIENPSSE